MKKSGIYMLLNIENNKKYIGSSVDINRRKREHLNSLNSDKHYNTHLQRAYNKVGAKKFHFLILEEGVKKENLHSVEIEYIEKYNTLKPEFGYNKGMPVKNSTQVIPNGLKEKKRRIAYKQFHVNEKEKFCEAKYLVWREALLKKRNSRLSKEEDIERKIKNLGQKIYAINNRTNELEKIYPSVGEFVREHKTEPYRVLDVLYYSFKGCTLVREENYDENYDYRKVSNRKPKKKSLKKKYIKKVKIPKKVEIFNLETKEVITIYNSVEELAKAYGSNKKYICGKVLTGLKKSFRGLGVRYKN